MGYTLSRYWAEVAAVCKTCTTKPIGRIAFDVLDNRRPDIVAFLRGTQADPSNIGALPPDFVDEVKRRWGDDPPAYQD